MPLHVSACLMAGLVSACRAGAAFAQQDAFDQAAMQSIPQGRSGVLNTLAPGLRPNVPKAVSRPEGWPTGKPHVPGGDNHVLSSIRANPGAPLEPVRDLIASEVAKAVGTGAEPGGVAPAAYEEPAGATDPRIPQTAQSLETAMVVARVGPEVVLEGDLLTPKALEWLDKVSPGMPPEDLRKLRLQICQQVVPQHVETLRFARTSTRPSTSSFCPSSCRRPALPTRSNTSSNCGRRASRSTGCGRCSSSGAWPRNGSARTRTPARRSPTPT
jgi:hypothetical protein